MQYIRVFCNFSTAFVIILFPACTPATPTDQQSGDASVQATPAPIAGSVIFDKNCKICHGSDGSLGLNGAKDLTLSKLTTAERVNLVEYGKNIMPPFGKTLTPQEIEAVVAYTFQLQK
jgi:cytochrome c6